MSPAHLPTDFALQSASPIIVVELVPFERGVVALLVANGYPASGALAFANLSPGRYYRLGGVGSGFCKAGADGTVRTLIAISRSCLLTLAPVV